MCLIGTPKPRAVRGVVGLLPSPPIVGREVPLGGSSKERSVGLLVAVVAVVAVVATRAAEAAVEVIALRAEGMAGVVAGRTG